MPPHRPFLYRSNIRVVFIATITGMILLAGIGYELGRWILPHPQNIQSVEVIQGVLVGVLSLLLGFTYALASARYDARWQQIVDEANAIGTTFLRAQALPEPHPREVSELLRQYVDVRLALFDVGEYPNQIQPLLQDTNRLHTQLWSHAIQMGRDYPESIVVGLFINSLNSVIDMHATRLAFIRARIPEIIVRVLAVIIGVTFLATGIISGLQGARLPIITSVAAIIIALVTIMIIDLDRPLMGITRLSSESLANLRDSMNQYLEDAK